MADVGWKYLGTPRVRAREGTYFKKGSSKTSIHKREGRAGCLVRRKRPQRGKAHCRGDRTNGYVRWDFLGNTSEAHPTQLVRRKSNELRTRRKVLWVRNRECL